MGHDIVLTDGSVLNIKINFLTVYLLNKQNIDKLLKKSEKNKDAQIEVAANVIYCIIRSSGKKVTFDEALILVPPDADVIKQIVEDFKVKFGKFKKKENSKM